MKTVKFLCLLFSVMVFISCESDKSSAPPSGECSILEQNQVVYEIMKDSYLWYDQIPSINPAAYNSPDELLNALMYSQDRWSFIMTAEEYNEYYEEGRYAGMGFSAAFDNTKRLWIEYVYDNSPADLAGMKRSDEILAINGLSVSYFSDLYALWDEIYRYDTAYISFKDIDGIDNNINLHWNWVTVQTALYSDVITTDSGAKVGYLVFNGFIEPSSVELYNVFKNFKDEAIDELILDLRYNGGGRLDVAGYLASLIHKPDTDAEIFAAIQFNNKYTDYNSSIMFNSTEESLDLSRVFVITTESTCSASEVVINSLIPFLDEVVIIGSATCGKPVGMTAHEFCDIVLLPIEFRTANAQGTTNYFNGLQPTCNAEDDLTKDFGVETESSLATAIYYIENDACMPVPVGATRTLNTIPAHQMNQRHGLWSEIRAF